MMTMRARRLGNGSYALVLAAVLALLVGCQGRAGDDAGTGSGSLSTGRSSPARSASGKPPSVTPSTDGGSSLSPTGGSAGDYPLGVFSCRLWYRGDTSNPLERTSRVLSAAGQRARFVHRDLTVQLSLGGPEGPPSDDTGYPGATFYVSLVSKKGRATTSYQFISGHRPQNVYSDTKGGFTGLMRLTSSQTGAEIQTVCSWAPQA